MPHLQTEVPDPLRNDLPALLTASSMRAPAIWVLFVILIGKLRLKGATMQIDLDDIGGGERVLRQRSEEEFVDDTGPREANRTLLFAGRMGGYHHATWRTLGTHQHLWAVVEAAHHLAFRALLKLIGRQVQTRLDERVIEDRVLFATGHKSEASQVSEYGSCPILAIEPRAAVRGLISPVQPGRTRKEVLESPCLPGT